MPAPESISLEKDAPTKGPEYSVRQPASLGPTTSFDPFVETILGGALPTPSDSVAGSLTIQRLKTPVLQRTQRLYGNRASQEIVMRARSLQRQCNCGGTCARCQEEKEQRVLQRNSTAAAPAEFDGIPSDSGEPLEARTRHPLEAHFGVDLSDVRVHAGSEAADSATKLDALAYTTRRDIYFAPGMYAPASDSGRRLLAHEVAHVVQQGSGKEPSSIATKSARGVKIGAPDDILETEADQSAEAFMSGVPLTDEEQRKRREAGSAVQRFIQRQDGGGAPAPASTPSDATPAPAPAPAAPSVAERRQQYEAALANARITGNWQDAAEKLNIFNHEDIQNYLAQLSDQEVGYLHQGALDNPRLGDQSAVALLTAPGTPRASTAPPSASAPSPEPAPAAQQTAPPGQPASTATPAPAQSDTGGLTTGEKVLVGALIGAAVVGGIALIVLSGGTAAPAVITGLEVAGDVAAGTELAAGTAVVGTEAAAAGTTAAATGGTVTGLTAGQTAALTTAVGAAATPQGQQIIEETGEALESFAPAAEGEGQALSQQLQSLAPQAPAAADIAESVAPAVSNAFTPTELEVVQEVRNIPLGQLRSAFEAGGAELNIGGRTILVDPGVPSSGFSLFGEDGFVIGREAFTSDAELTKTLLHELFRLATTQSAAGVSGELARSETDAAATFAERAFTAFFK